MDFNLTTEQKLIQKATRDFAEKEIAPIVLEMEKGAPLPAEAIQKMAKARLLGMLAPKKYGGSETGYLAYVLANEQFSYVITACSFVLVVCNSIAEAISRFGTEEQKEKYVRGISEGRLMGSLSFTEPATGSDPKALATTAVLEGENWIINGTKRFNTLGAYDGPALLFAREGDAVHCIIVDKNCAGYTSSKPWEFMGYRGAPTVDSYLNNVSVPRGNLLWERGKGFEILLKIISGARISSCARSLGVGQAALDESIKYAKQRTRRGSPIASMMSIQSMIAEMVSRLEAARWLTYRTAFLREKGGDVLLESAMTKIFVTRTAKELADMGLQIHGAYGFTKDFKIERIYRAAKEGEVVEGANEIQRTIVASMLLA